MRFYHAWMNRLPPFEYSNFWDGVPAKTIFNQRYESLMDKDQRLPNLSSREDVGVLLNTPDFLGWPSDTPGHFSLTIVEHLRSIDMLCIGVRECLRCMADHHRQSGRQPLYKLHMPTFAFVVVGGKAFNATMGELLDKLLATLQHAAVDFGCDVVLLCWERADFDMLQTLRRHMVRDQPEALLDLQSGVSASLRAEAERLAELSGRKALAVFAGAGVSVNAGLPNWTQLLDMRASRAGIDHKSSDWRELNVLSKADLIAKKREGGRQAMFQDIVHIFDQYQRCSLVHLMINSLNCDEIVTTNYDELLEKALTSYGRAPELSRLPHAPSHTADRWILKLHGCVSQPSSIVLTRQEYIRFSEQASALGGIVQAKLMTSHMLFVGFSLDDDNFFKICDTVNRSQPEEELSTPFGTALMPRAGALKKELWQGQVELVAMQDDGEANMGVLGRRIALFLDYLALKATSAACPILDERFEYVMNEGQKELSEKIKVMVDGLSATARDTDEFKMLEETLKRFTCGTEGWRFS